MQVKRNHLENSAFLVVAIFLLGSLLSACSRTPLGKRIFAAESAGISPAIPVMTEIPNPAAAKSFYPMLTSSSRGDILLSWLEPLEGSRSRLRFATHQVNDWDSPSTVTESYFAPYATMIPGVYRLGSGALFAHWTDWDHKWVYTSTSRDEGRHWTDPLVVHKDRSDEDHGFVSAVDDGDAASIVWLDGREEAQQHKFILLEAHVSSEGKVTAETMLDDDVCTCCPTAIVTTGEGLLVAYRDHTSDGVRDISLVRFNHGAWSSPHPLHHDGWMINGCPSNSVALASYHQRIAAAWFTGANDKPRVNFAFSQDSGKNFTEPIQVDSGNPFGYPSVVLLDSGDALVSWLEKGDTSYKVQIVRVSQGREKSAPLVVASGSRKELGYPHLQAAGHSIMIAWGSEKGIRTALIH